MTLDPHASSLVSYEIAKNKYSNVVQIYYQFCYYTSNSTALDPNLVFFWTQAMIFYKKNWQIASSFCGGPQNGSTGLIERYKRWNKGRVARGGKRWWGTIQCGEAFKFSIHTIWNLNLVFVKDIRSSYERHWYSAAFILLCALEEEVKSYRGWNNFGLKSSQMAVGLLLLRGASSTKTILHQVNRRMLENKK